MNVPRASKAYRLKSHSERTWEIVARAVGYPPGKAKQARLAARRYARREGLPWPAPGARGRGRLISSLPLGRQAYELRAAGGKEWREIAIEVGYSPEHQGRTALMMACKI